MNASCVLLLTLIPVNTDRVVWALWVTIATFVPTRRFRRVDLPAFGAPISAIVANAVSGTSGTDLLQYAGGGLFFCILFRAGPGPGRPLATD